MKYRLTIFVILTILTFGCTAQMGPKIHYFKRDGQHWYNSKIYGYPNGKRKLVQIDTYKKQNHSPDSKIYDLQESIIFYELWPNYEWKFVSKAGFTKFKNGIYCLNNNSIIVPDNVIYKSLDKDFVERIEVYKDGKRINYNYGYPDGHQTMQFSRDKPGIYNWKNGSEHFQREFTEEELENHKKMNETLNPRTTSDTSKTK